MIQKKKKKWFIRFEIKTSIGNGNLVQLIQNWTSVDDSIVNQKVIPSNFGEVKIVDDYTDDLAIIKDIVKSKEDEDPFYIFDIGEVIRVHRRMITKIPRVEPYYGI